MESKLNINEVTRTVTCSKTYTVDDVLDICRTLSLKELTEEEAFEVLKEVLAVQEERNSYTIYDEFESDIENHIKANY